MPFKAVLLLLPVTFCFCLSAGAESPLELKSNSLRYLQDLRSQNVKRLREIDTSLANKIEDSGSVTIETEVSHLRAARREHMLRQEFLDRLIFQIDTKFSGGDMKSFVERSLVNMAKVDVSSQAESGLWKFLKYASDAVRRLPEQKENVLAFLEGYMNRSVTNPMKPEDYLSTRNYTNGTQNESGSPLNRDEVGTVADRRLQEAAATSQNQSAQ